MTEKQHLGRPFLYTQYAQCEVNCDRGRPGTFEQVGEQASLKTALLSLPSASFNSVWSRFTSASRYSAIAPTQRSSLTSQWRSSRVYTTPPRRGRTTPSLPHPRGDHQICTDIFPRYFYPSGTAARVHHRREQRRLRRRGTKTGETPCSRIVPYEATIVGLLLHVS